MSKIKRPSFLQLNSYDQSEYYLLRQPKGTSLTKNIWSPTNSVETEYSPAGTPSSPDFLSSPSNDESYLPFSTTHFRSTTPVTKFDFIDDPFRSSNSYSIDSSPDRYDFDRSQNSAFETPDWYNESVNMNESFNYYESTHMKNDNLVDDSSELNRTLTSVDKYETGYSMIGDLAASDENDTQFNRTESIETDENCPILFKQLMDLAESSYINCVRKAEVMKANQSVQMTTNQSSVYSKFCKFCKNNREPRKFYLSHSTISENGDIVCPILQQYKCELCGSTGTKAHTRSYCPFSKMIREAIPDINDTYEFYNKRSMIHSTDAHLFDNDFKEDLYDN